LRKGRGIAFFIYVCYPAELVYGNNNPVVPARRLIILRSNVGIGVELMNTDSE